ncbi:hypothetical protein AB4Z46_21940 [Variovorax sp. M-6]|uniref:hypothetical protein n=1 Tax=Variovorax sp. M-6 TaxID=3233041 RepID=UPI003F96F32D
MDGFDIHLNFRTFLLCFWKIPTNIKVIEINSTNQIINLVLSEITTTPCGAGFFPFIWGHFPRTPGWRLPSQPPRVRAKGRANR